MSRKLPSSIPTPSASVTMDEVIASQKASRALPSRSEIKSAFGEAAARTGEVNLDLSTEEGRRNRGKLLDIVAPWARAESQRGEAMQANTEKVAMRNPSGERVLLPASHAEAALERGFRDAGFSGRWTERVIYHNDGSRTVWRREPGRGIVRVEG